MSRTRLTAVSHESAYRVPWVFERGDGRYTLRNLGTEALTGVTFYLYGTGFTPSTAPTTLYCGEVLEIVISGQDLARDTIGIVRWFRPNGQEYLWRVSF